MATYCGTADCILVSRDWTALTLDGTTSYASDYITAASEWADARIADWRGPVPPLSSGGTVYDYWLKRATANYAVYMAYDSVMRDKYEAGTDPYWTTYRTTAEKIMDDLRERVSSMTDDTATWERGIAPARGVVNGTITAPYAGIMVSNAEYGGIYTGNVARTYLVRLDGSGTTIHGQTFAWQYKGGTAWEQSGVTIHPDQWHGLSSGVMACWPTQANAAVAVGQTWEIPCFPARGGNYGGKGLRSWDVQIG
jgi:hypothetical protein